MTVRVSALHGEAAGREFMGGLGGTHVGCMIE
jgi:hypothetical protein